MGLKSQTEKDATASETSPSPVVEVISDEREAIRPTRSRLGPFAVMILMAAVGAVLVLRLWIARDRTRALDEWHGRLTAIADDRRRAIEIWVKERRADARVLASSPAVAYRTSGRPLPRPPHAAIPEATQDVGQILSIAAEAYGYRELWLLACDGAVLAKSASGAALTEATGAAARRGCDGKSEVVAFRRAGDAVRLHITAPVPSNGSNARAVILAETDPGVVLYPLLQAEPLPTRTGEALLVSREGKDVLFLSPLRHDAAAPLTLRLPPDPGLAGAESLADGERFGPYLDYRAHRVLAATRPIEGTDWALVVKVDEVEALAAHRASGRAASVGVLGLLSALLSVGFVLWRGESAAYETRLGGYRAQLASLLDHANDAILFTRRDGRIFHANRRAEKLYGYTLEELVRTPLHELRADGDAGQVEAVAEAIVRKGALVFETVHRRRDRTTVDVEVSSAALEHEGQTVFLALVRDITERKAAEALRSGEHHVLEMIASSAPLPETLEALVRVIEKQGDGLLGSVLLLEGTRLRHGAAPSLPEAYSRAIDGEEIGPSRGSCGTSAYLRQPVIVTDIATDPLWSEFRDLALSFGLRSCWSVPVVARDGSVLGTFALYYREPRSPTAEQMELIERARHVAAIAITRLRNETALRRQALVFGNISDAVVVTDLEGRITDWNVGAERMFGYTRAEALGRTPGLIRGAGDELVPHVFEALREKGRFESEIPFVRKDGGRGICHTVVVPLRDEAGEMTAAVGVSRDITARRQLEDELRELSGHVERVREDERTAIAREIHDELGQSLTALKMDISWLARRLGPPREPRPDLVARLDRMSKATDATIDEVRRIAADLRPGVLDELGLRAAVEWQSREFQERTQIACAVHSNLDEGRLDPELSTGVFRILQEALTNVARHAQARHVEVVLCQDGQGLTLKVRDDGRGVDAKATSRSGRFGLLGMRERARRLGGTLQVSGRPGEGTEVVLSLPTEGVSERAGKT